MRLELQILTTLFVLKTLGYNNNIQRQIYVRANHDLLKLK